MMIDRCIHLAYFDPAKGHVPNPGMGINAYVFSDHMHYGFSMEEYARTEQTNPNRKLARETLERMLELPYVDNLYFRIDWNRIQREPGKLHLPEEWEWMLEAVRQKGKRWSFRIMNASRHSEGAHSVPAFLENKLKLDAYESGYKFGPPVKYYPRYDEEYLKWWRELLELLAERYDRDPLLEYVDISGYGIWGEGHHYGRRPGEESNSNMHAENAEHVVSTLIRDHIDAFVHTPVAMTLHYLDYQAGIQALRDTDCWLRRDSFQKTASPEEYEAVANIGPGRAVLWETIIPMGNAPAPLFMNRRLPQRYFDFNAHYAAVGFNPWDVLIAHQYIPDIYEELAKNLGYRIRPSIIWRRINALNEHELIVALANDGCSQVPGVLTLSAQYPDGQTRSVELPTGAPLPGDKRMYVVPMPPFAWSCSSESQVSLSLSIRIKSKCSPVRWAVRETAADPFVLAVPLRTPPDGDPFLVPSGGYNPSL